VRGNKRHAHGRAALYYAGQLHRDRRRWNVEVVLRRAGHDDVRHTFQLDILRSAAQTQ
jgi:hypothetical protein